MKKSSLILALQGVLVSAALAGDGSEWWRDPNLKYAEPYTTTADAPHYWNKDEDDQVLFVTHGFSGGSMGYLYGIPALISAESGADVAPIVSSSATALGLGASWKSAALSSALGRIVTCPASTTRHASLPYSATWTKNVNAFEVTNITPNITFDAADFGTDGTYLFSNDIASGARHKIYMWKVLNLSAHGNALTNEAIFATSIARVRTVSVYGIGGKDLVYYGEGTGGSKVAALDPSTGTEYILLNGGLPASDVMSVKVGGIGYAKMHLYVHYDNFQLNVYELASDGMSVVSATPVKTFSTAEMKQLLGVQSWVGADNMRCFEVTNDEQFAFVGHHGIKSSTDRTGYVNVLNRKLSPGTMIMIL